MYFAEIASNQVRPHSPPLVIPADWPQLEFKYLAHLTGESAYWRKPDAVTRRMAKLQDGSSVPGLFGTDWYVESGDMTNGAWPASQGRGQADV